MRHPSADVLRRLLDEPAAVADPDRHHVARCPDCLGRLAAAGGRDAPGDDGPRTRTPLRRLLRRLLRRPVTAAVAVTVVLAGAGAAAAQDWLPIFRTEQVAPVSLRPADGVAVPDLAAYGDVVVTGGDAQRVPDAAAAAARTGLAVPRVTTLPRGITGEAEHHVLGQVSATFTFSADRAARAAADAGGTLPPPPPGLDGEPVRLVAGPASVQTWAEGPGVPLVVVRAVAPTAFSTGLPFTVARDYLLSLPGVPAELAARLRTFAADGSTLPLPVPADVVSTTSAEVGGLPATVLRTHDRTLAAVVWVDDGVVTAVAGPLDVDEVLSVARDLA